MRLRVRVNNLHRFWCGASASGEGKGKMGRAGMSGVLRRESGFESLMMFLHPQSWQGIVFDLRGMMQ